MNADHVRLRWVKALASVDGNNCVEVAADGEWILVRNSREPTGPVLRFTHAEWTAFHAGIAGGEFTLAALTGTPADVDEETSL